MIFVFLFFSFLFSTTNTSSFADGVLAVVGNEVVLVSDVLEETHHLASQKGINPNTSPFLYDKLFNDVLNNKVNELVVLFYAKKDSSLFVSKEDVDQALESRVSVVLEQFVDEKDFENKTGFSINEMKSQYWDSMENDLYWEKFKMSLFRDITINKNEVVSFYNNNKDSLSSIPQSASFSLYEKKVAVLKNSDVFLLNKINSVRDSLLVGLIPFSSAVLTYSDYPGSKTNKGIMESMRGDFLKEFEKAAYSLNKNEISGVIKTDVGYFLIKLLERRGEKIKTQFILFKKENESLDFDSSVSFLDSLKNSYINDPVLFDSLAVLSSEKNSFSGVYSKVDVSFLPFEIQQELLNTPNFSFSNVIKGVDSCFLFYKKNYLKERKPTIENDWFIIESFALNKKRESLLLEWINEKKKTLYVKINDF